MINDPYQTQEQFNREVAEIEWMDRLDAETPTASTPLSPLGHSATGTSAGPTGAVAASIIGAVAGAYDARLIRQARELAGARTTEDRRAWHLANGRPEAGGYTPEAIDAITMGTMQYLLSSLAAGYERELAAVKALTSRAPVTGRDVLLASMASMGTGNVNDDDEESLQFADESEWMDEDA